MNFSFIKNNDIRDSCESILRFLQHPIDQVKSLPDWSWRRLLIATVVISSLAGFVKSFFAGNKIFAAFIGVFFNPILTLIMLLLSGVFFYYCMQVFLNKTVDFRKLFLLLFFANLPLTVFQVISDLLPPITLVGLMFSSFIIIVGLNEMFGVEKKWAIRFVGTAYALLFVVWIAGRIKTLDLERKFDPELPKAPQVELNK